MGGCHLSTEGVFTPPPHEGCKNITDTAQPQQQGDLHNKNRQYITIITRMAAHRPTLLGMHMLRLQCCRPKCLFV